MGELILFSFISLIVLCGLYNKCWGKKNRAYEKNIKKVEHKFEKSVKMELIKNQNGGQNYALHLFYRKTNRMQGIIINNIERNEKEE